MDNIFEPSKQKIPFNFRGKFKLSWIEESFDLEQSSHEGLNIAHTRSYLGKSVTPKKIKIFLIIVIAGLLSLLIRVSYLQIVRGNYYRSLSEKNRVRLIAIPSERGVIYDRFNTELVQNVPNFLLSIVPQKLPSDSLERDKIIQRVAELGGLSVEEIKKKLEKYQNFSYQSLVIKENLDYKTALQLYSQNSDLPGILIESGFKRHYLSTLPSASNSSTQFLSLSHLLGYLGKINDEEWEEMRQSKNNYLVSDNIGKTGLEKMYESELRGIYGYKKIEVDALEREQNVLSVEAPIPGQNLFLTIDLEAQAKLESIIKNILEKNNKKRAAAIALDPRNGEIIALVSYPSFNNNDFSGGISSSTYKRYIDDPNRPLFNRAIGGSYPPGSTAKIIIAAAALQEKIISENTSFNSTGGLRINRWFFPDWKAGGHGITNVTKAIAWSVNTFFYYVGGGYDTFSGLGVDKIVSYLSLFNLGQKTGIDLPGEKDGFVPSREWKLSEKKESWFIGDTYNLSIGQGDLLVTPLQVAQWTSSIANGGKIIQPHLTQKIVDASNKKEVVVKPHIIRQNFINPENIAIIKRGMKECVTMGSCKLLQNLSFSTGGKTGTAQWNKNFHNHAWFTAFAPYENPSIIITVLIEEGEEGSATALPVAYDFLNWWGKKYLTH